MHKRLDRNLFLMAANGMKCRAHFLNGWVSGTLHSPAAPRVYGDAQIETPEYRNVYFDAHHIEYVLIEWIESQDPDDEFRKIYEQLLTMEIAVDAPHLKG